MSRPTVKRLLRLVDDTPLRLVEHAFCAGVEVAAHYDGDTVTLSLSFARSRNKSDYLVSSLVHELIHASDMKATEDTVLRWELTIFKTSRALREACLTKIVNCVVFGEE